MSLIAERSVWDWGDRIAKEHDERNGQVLVELLTAIERRELPAYLPNSAGDLWRGALLPLINHVKGFDEALHRNMPIPLPEGGLPLPRMLLKIMVAAPHVDSWLARRLAAQQQPSDPMGAGKREPERQPSARVATQVEAKTKPTDAELDVWMSENVQRGVKRLNAICDCRAATGATSRAAAAAWNRLPQNLKLTRGQRSRQPEIEQ
jgi:hypothetical protein